MGLLNKEVYIMLFRKKIARSCSYCAYSAKLEGDQVLCAKRGFMPMDGKCMKFRYDPCKRIPVKAKALDFSRYEEADFSL